MLLKKSIFSRIINLLHDKLKNLCYTGNKEKVEPSETINNTLLYYKKRGVAVGSDYGIIAYTGGV